MLLYFQAMWYARIKLNVIMMGVVMLLCLITVVSAKQVASEVSYATEPLKLLVEL